MPTLDPAPASAPSSPGRRLAAALGLALLVIAVYRPAFDFGFLHFDDPEAIGHPAVVRGLTVDGVAWVFRHAVAAVWSPLTAVSHMVDRSLFGPDPRGPHVVNVLLHALNVALLFWILQAATGAPRRSLAVAAIWGLHPLRVESVAWVAERKDVLSGLFFLLTLAAYGSWARRPTARRYALVTLACVAALLSKPMAVTLPGVLLLADVWPLRRLGVIPDFPTLGRRVAEKLPWIAAAIATAGVEMLAARHVVAASAAPLADRLANAVVAISVYLEKTLAPVGLAVLYPFRDDLPASRVAVAIVLALVITTAALVVARRRPAALVGWLGFLLTLLPVIGIVQAGPQALADRFTYLPAIGLLAGVAWTVPGGRIAGRRRVLAAVLALAAVATLAVLTRRALAPWRDQVSLFERALAVSGPDPLILVNLGTGLLARGDVLAGVARMREATEVAPYSVRARASYAAVLVTAGDLAEASRQAEIVLRLGPGPRELETVAWVRRLRGDLDGAEEALLAAVALDPASPELRSALAEVRRTRGR